MQEVCKDRLRRVITRAAILGRAGWWGWWVLRTGEDADLLDTLGHWPRGEWLIRLSAGESLEVKHRL